MNKRFAFIGFVAILVGLFEFNAFGLALAREYAFEPHNYFLGSKAISTQRPVMELCSPRDGENLRSYSIVAKDYSDGSIDFLPFDAGDYSYRELAFDRTPTEECETEAIFVDDSSGNRFLSTVSKQSQNSPASSIYSEPLRCDLSSAIGRIETKFFVENQKEGTIDELTFSSTGFLTGSDLVVGAGHCFFFDPTSPDYGYDDGVENPRFPDQIVFYPGGKEEGISIERAYIEKEFYLYKESDWAAGKLDMPIGEETGYFSIVRNYCSYACLVHSIGYAGEDCGRPTISDGFLKESDGKTYISDLESRPGQSGSPVIATIGGKEYVVGVNAFGAGRNSGGTIIDDFVFAFLDSFVGATNVETVSLISEAVYDRSPIDSDDGMRDFSTESGIEYRARKYKTAFAFQNELPGNQMENAELYWEFSFKRPLTKVAINCGYSKEAKTKGEALSSMVLQTWNDETKWSNRLSEDNASFKPIAYGTNQKIVEFDDLVYRFRIYCLEIEPDSLDIYFQTGNYFPLSGSELPYEPEKWNSEPVIEGTNCYSYAINNQVYPGTNDLFFMRPGEYHGVPLSSLEVDEIVQCCKRDFAKYSNTYHHTYIFGSIGKYVEPPEGMYKVALLVADSIFWRDFHFIRQDADGYWSHKMGNEFVRRYDFDNDNYDPIIDPETCYLGFFEFCGFYAVHPWNNMYEEE